MKDILNKIFKILSSIVFAILVFIIIAIISYVLRVNYLASQDRLGEIRTNFYTILTQSMYPNIKAGDIVITYREDENKYKEGDVITFISETNGNILITHRIKEVYKNEDLDSYKTKGDNNNAADSEIVPYNNVLGKVVVKIPKAGHIQQFLVSKTGWIIAIILPSLAIIIYDILKLVKGSIGKKRKYIDTDSEEVKKSKEKLKKILDDHSVVEEQVVESKQQDKEKVPEEEKKPFVPNFEQKEEITPKTDSNENTDDDIEVL